MMRREINKIISKKRNKKGKKQEKEIKSKTKK